MGLFIYQKHGGLYFDLWNVTCKRDLLVANSNTQILSQSQVQCTGNLLACEQALYLGLTRDLFWAASGERRAATGLGRERVRRACRDD